jgi:DNA repair exonuclease SbcCD ATPase subunit
MKTISVSLEDLEGILRENRELQSRLPSVPKEQDEVSRLAEFKEKLAGVELQTIKREHAEAVRISKGRLERIDQLSADLEAANLRLSDKSIKLENCQSELKEAQEACQRMAGEIANLQNRTVGITPSEKAELEGDAFQRGYEAGKLAASEHLPKPEAVAVENVKPTPRHGLPSLNEDQEKVLKAVAEGSGMALSAVVEKTGLKRSFVCGCILMFSHQRRIVRSGEGWVVP